MVLLYTQRFFALTRGRAPGFRYCRKEPVPETPEPETIPDERFDESLDLASLVKIPVETGGLAVSVLGRPRPPNERFSVEFNRSGSVDLASRLRTHSAVIHRDGRDPREGARRPSLLMVLKVRFLP